MPPNFTRPPFLSCWRAISMWFRPTAIFIPPSPMTRTRCCSRKAARLFRRILEQGWVDAIRKLHPDAPMYTFWDYMRNRWPRDAGLRIDHLLLSDESAKRLLSAGVDREVRGKDGGQRPCPCMDRITRNAAAADAPAARNRRRPSKVDRKANARPRKAGCRTPPVTGDRRRFVRAPLLSRAAKTILRTGDRPAGAILGFANFLLRIYQAEQPRAVIVGWDTLDAPTYRHLKFPAYQSGRKFDDALIEQLPALPEFVAACGFANAQAPGYEADDFLAAAVADEERARRQGSGRKRRPRHLPARVDKNDDLYPIRAGEMARIGPAKSANVTASNHSRFRISSPCGAIRQTGCPARPGLVPRVPPASCESTALWNAPLKAGRFPSQAEGCCCSGRSRLWTARRHCHG